MHLRGQALAGRAPWLWLGLVIVVAAVALAPRAATLAQEEPSGDNGAVNPPPSGGRAAATLIGPAAAVPIDGLWQEFSFLQVGVQARGCFPNDPAGLQCTPSSGGNSQFAPAPPWTFTAGPTGAVLTVTDAFLTGDRFNIFDNGVFIGQTSAVPAGFDCGSDPVVCLSTASNATLNLGPGPHSITIVPTSVVSGGAAYFRITTGTTPVTTCTQSVAHVGGNTTLQYTVATPVPVTWNLYLIIGNSVTTIVSTPLGPLGPTVVGPVTFPFPPAGTVGWLTTFTTLTGGIVCSDFDLANTGASPTGSVAPASVDVPIRVPSPSQPQPQPQPGGIRR